jgi:hypothetical protein
MPSRAQRGMSPPSETFRFAIEDWRLDYSLHLWDEKPMEDMERCWELFSVVSSGGLLKSKTKRRKITRVELSISPLDFDPKKPQPHWKGIGSVGHVSRGVLTAHVTLPVVSFQTVVAALTAGNLKALAFDAYKEPHGNGLIKSLSTFDPEHVEDED